MKDNKDKLTNVQVRQMLTDFVENSTTELLEEGKEKDELFEIAAARGINLKTSTDIAGIKFIYAFADKPNKNNCILPAATLLKSLPGMIGKPISADHDRRFVIGTIIDYRWIHKEKKVIAYAIIFKSSFADEWEEMKKMFKANQLATSFEIFCDRAKRKYNQDKTYELSEMLIAGAAILFKTSPAFPGAKVLEMAKKRMEPDLVYASQYKDEDILVAESTIVPPQEVDKQEDTKIEKIQADLAKSATNSEEAKGEKEMEVKEEAKVEETTPQAESEVVEAKSEEVVEKVEPTPEAPKAEEAKTEEAPKEEPKAEEAKEEPKEVVPEAPKVEEVKKEEAAEAPKEEPKPEETKEVAKEEPKAEEPKVDEAARGDGQGKGGPRQGDGGTDKCVCPKCGAEYPHTKGEPCTTHECAKCGTSLVGKKAEEAKVEEPKQEEAKEVEPAIDYAAELKTLQMKSATEKAKLEKEIESLKTQVEFYKANAEEINKRRKELGEYAKELSDVEILDGDKFAEKKLDKANKEIENASLVGTKTKDDSWYKSVQAKVDDLAWPKN